ncbi:MULTISPECIES: tRNA pseudouridine(38-40) synthase TruA [unclassified Fusibacter]|uniref:tRNA pseudouridine(38-40) synthase TruA n=1 Tax=unclassified Fusibacter TaxID=2624464 RepID=UPI001012A59C|nr:MULTISPECIES: tRNA pseudouridine(38-40) synthase TruA [unclassified Fusibacter]MCK8059804.1 tRNA pseudouridine(38-40) synthase TruA [Fusibacter sp. A2]NPE21605.1 tRNA pseudouridine(38-40) synthase TruA [Fusibacter sp. A1]RXV62012.1 tRNA pseudouridine(38-40) synthase TruA [Fusibacter sp. A1]
MNIKLIIAYDGTHYAGWQRLKDKKSIQGKIEETLTQLLEEPIEIIGAGRTDAGVHAMGQVANFKTVKKVDPKKLKTDLNHYLPADIRVLAAEKADPRFHARHNATVKHYRYNIQQDIVLPFERDYSVQAEKQLDLDAMQKAANILIGKHDFTSFTNVKIGKKSPEKTIEDIFVSEEEGQITIDFFGDGFLYHMVRKIVSTLLAVGYGELSFLEVRRILDAKNRSEVPGLAPAKGLFLVQVMYNDEDDA